MNCKQGDLAIVVKGINAGKIVEVLRFLGESPQYAGYIWERGKGPCWLVKSNGTPLKTNRGLFYLEVPMLDSSMRPIRPDEQDDETQDNRELEKTEC